MREVYGLGGMKRKKTKSSKKTAAPKPRNPPRNIMARALKESGLFRPKVVPGAKDEPYRRRAKHPKPITDEGS